MTAPTRFAAVAPAVPLQITKKMLQTLAPLPDTAVQLLALLDDPDASLRQISDVATKDVGIAAAILRMANSPVLGMRGRVGTISEALRLLGTVQARLVVLACGVARAGQKEMPLYGLEAGAFLRHSELVARLTMTIARECRYAEIGVAYSAGLLHDMGKVIVNALARQDEPDRARHQELGELLCGPERDLVSAERAIFGTDHPTLGRDLAALWALPAEIGEAIHRHHAGAANGEATLSSFLSLANAVAIEADPSYPMLNRVALPAQPLVPTEPLLELARELPR